MGRKNAVPDVKNAGGDFPNSNRSKGEVILWLDTFNNYLHPETTRAAYEVLTTSGWKVRVPHQPLCCGRPLYDFGMLEEAKSYLRSILEALSEPIDAALPVVVLEPSCAWCSATNSATCCPITSAPSASAIKHFY